jgi:hypothetical protein
MNKPSAIIRLWSLKRTAKDKAMNKSSALTGALSFAVGFNRRIAVQNQDPSPSPYFIRLQSKNTIGGIF